jgi:hypothetical protein
MTNIEDKDWSRSEGDSWDIVSSVGFTALGRRGGSRGRERAA